MRGQPLQAFAYASWGFASLLVTLRVQVTTGTLGIWLSSRCPFSESQYGIETSSCHHLLLVHG
jgi:hypothetical protein